MFFQIWFWLAWFRFVSTPPSLPPPTNHPAPNIPAKVRNYQCSVEEGRRGIFSFFFFDFNSSKEVFFCRPQVILTIFPRWRENRLDTFFSDVFIFLPKSGFTLIKLSCITHRVNSATVYAGPEDDGHKGRNTGRGGRGVGGGGQVGEMQLIRNFKIMRVDVDFSFIYFVISLRLPSIPENFPNSEIIFKKLFYPETLQLNAMMNLEINK